MLKQSRISLTIFLFALLISFACSDFSTDVPQIEKHGELRFESDEFTGLINGDWRLMSRLEIRNRDRRQHFYISQNDTMLHRFSSGLLEMEWRLDTLIYTASSTFEFDSDQQLLRMGPLLNPYEVDRYMQIRKLDSEEMILRYTHSFEHEGDSFNSTRQEHYRRIIE